MLSHREITTLVQEAQARAQEFGEDFVAYFDSEGYPGDAMGMLALSIVHSFGKDTDELNTFMQDVVGIKKDWTEDECMRLAGVFMTCALAGMIAGTSIEKGSNEARTTQDE